MGGGGSRQSQLTPQGRRGRGVGLRLTAGFYHAKAHLSFSVENELLQRGRRGSLKCRQMVAPAELAYLMVPVGDGRGLMA